MWIPLGVALVIVRVYFQVPFRGNPFLLFVGRGGVPAVRHRARDRGGDTDQVGAAGTARQLLHLPPLMSLSGTMTPAEAMPAWMRSLTVINPVYHFGFMSRGVLIRGASFIDLWPHLVALAAIATVLMAVSVWRFRQQLS